MKNPYNGGDLCVVRLGETWGVAWCHGPGNPEWLGKFASFDEAASFAVGRRIERAMAGEGYIPIHFPATCPCPGQHPVDAVVAQAAADPPPASDAAAK